uniref:Uncharacterized protein n=1 Tax=Anopheles farauti TaxID=69004 RepID=A0A182QIP8_9DIPT
MIVPIGRPSSSRRTCSIHVLLLLVLLLTGVLASGSRVSRSKKHRTSRGASVGARWQSRASTDGTINTIHEPAAKPAPFSKPAHSRTSGQPKKRSYYAPTVTNLENNLHHFINNLKASKLAHAVTGVTGALQQAVQSIPAHGPINLLAGHRPVQNAAGYYANANELRYGQPFVSKQVTGGHFKSPPTSYGKKGLHGSKRGRHQPTAAPPGKYDSLMSDLGISGYKHFENAVIRDLERREELKVEATIHTLFPDDEDWRPIASIKKAPITAGIRGTAPEVSESKIVSSLTVPGEKRPLETSTRTTKPKPKATNASSSNVRLTPHTSTSLSPKSTAAPSQKHRTKSHTLGKDKRTKDRVKCWNCSTSTSTTRQPGPSVSYPTTARLPTTVTSSQRFGPTYDATMFYGNGGKAPAAIAQSYSNVEIQYNRTNAPPVFSVSSWTQGNVVSGTPAEVSTQSAPPVTTTFAAQSEVTSISSSSPSLPSTLYGGGLKKSFPKAPKPYVPATSYLGPQSEAAVTSATTHKPTGGSQGTKGTTKKRTNHRLEGPSTIGSFRRPGDQPGDSAGAGSVKSELRTKKKFDPKYSRNRGSIKFKDALEKNPDHIYR